MIHLSFLITTKGRGFVSLHPGRKSLEVRVTGYQGYDGAPSGVEL